jgi:hypothetical protein
MKKTFKDLVMESSEDLLSNIEDILAGMGDEEVDAIGGMIVDTYFDIDGEDEEDEGDEEVEADAMTVEDVMEYLSMLDDESLEEIYDSISGDVNEAIKLDKTSKADLKDAAKYRKSAEGKKVAKVQKIRMAKLSKKYANQIEKCKEKGKIFSFKTLDCQKAKERR